MKYFFLFLVIIHLAPVFAQERESFNRRFSAELGGGGGLYTLNYETDAKRILPKFMKWEVGLCIWPTRGPIFVNIPVSLNFVFGKSQHKFEVGTGQVFMAALGESGAYFRGTFRAGYRHQANNKRIFYKIAYEPYYSYLYNFQYQHWFAFGIGYQFTKKTRAKKG